MYMNNTAYYGGALYSLGFLVTTNTCQYINNRAYSGSVLYVSQILLNSSNNTYCGNIAEYAGAIYTFLQSSVFYNDSFVDNMAQIGAAVYQVYVSPSNISTCRFVNNTSVQSIYGVIYVSSSQLFISGECHFVLNYGPLYLLSSKATVLGHIDMNNNTNGTVSCIKNDLIIENNSTLLIYHNKAKYGGGMFLNRCNLLLHSSLHVMNNDALYGGGVYSYESGIVCRLGTTTLNIPIARFSPKIFKKHCPERRRSLS